MGIINQMTEERKEVITTLIKWYWNHAQKRNLITLSDFNFLYDIWESGISIYGTELQERLNSIREIYLEHQKL